MSRIIAGIYEIENKIGAGGGGIVYLGRHTRLEKQVVLKADKRTLDTDKEILRREVDMLKELSHTYIPQVYDFVQEDGVVYTVMDYIDGESLDKLLERKELPTQQQVIRWACQLLEALGYLHNHPPHGILHGDIKPANIMLRPNGDVCLIDFNIALALGEDGAVKVGFSRGYASPEHYGVSYISSNRTAAVGGLTDSFSRRLTAGGIGQPHFGRGHRETDSWQQEEGTWLLKDGDSNSTIKLPDEQTDKKTSKTPSAVSNTANGHKGIMLDARSDIYSLGATLYHLLSGHRPAQDAADVKPLGAEVCSPEIAAIISKAMAPDPTMRYQTAEEMRTAFLQLHQNDERMLRHRRRMKVWAAALTTLFLTGGGCSFVGLKQLEQRQEALALAEYSANALAQGDVERAIELALQGIPEKGSILEAAPTAQIQKALTDALGVYELSDGFKSLGLIQLSGAPFALTVSPDGSYTAAVYAYEVAVIDMEHQKKEAVLPTVHSALADAVFADETHLIYAGEGGVTAYDCCTGAVLWRGEEATTIAASADGAVAAAVNRDAPYAVLYRVSDGKKLGECFFGSRHMQTAANDIFANPDNRIFALNQDGSRLAVSFENGGLTVFDLEQRGNDMVIYEASDYKDFEGGFAGRYFCCTAHRNGESQLLLADTETNTIVGGYESGNELILQADERGIYLADGSLLVELDVQTMKEQELAYTGSQGIMDFAVGTGYVLVTTDEQGYSFYDRGAKKLLSGDCGENGDFTAVTDSYAVIGNRNEPKLRLFKLENHSQSQMLSYDVRYMHDEARVSQDEKTVMLFDYQGFRIYDMEGAQLAQVILPDAEQIYDQQFRKSGEGSWLEVIWYDGTVRCYSSSDGSLISEEKGRIPDKDLYEEFHTDKYCIASSLHEAPRVYDAETGRQVGVLEEDAYLTYVTQAGDYIITEYINTEGDRYGILLNEQLEQLAYLPGLCDTAGDRLYFDYGTGNLRYSRLYSLQELTALGKTYMASN